MTNTIKYNERSAGGIVFRETDGKIFWLIIKVLKRKNKGPVKARRGERRKFVYKLPKGHLKEGEFLKQAALREVAEEGKVKAKIVTKLGSNNYIYGARKKNGKVVKKVTFFLMRYIGFDDNQYSDAEKIVAREWLDLEKAGKKLSYESEKKLLKRAGVVRKSVEKNK